MKYRQTFREALKDVGTKDKTEVKSDEPTEDKDATIKRLQDEVAALKLKIETEKATAMKPEPNKDTGEVPLRTGVAAALLDKDGASPKIVKDNKKKLKMSLGKSKVTIDPNVDIGQISGGIQTGTGNLH